MGETKQGVRYYSRHDMEDVKKHFETRVYEIYPKYLVDCISVEKIVDGEEKSFKKWDFNQ
jgi:hypothetical protein